MVKYAVSASQKSAIKGGPSRVSHLMQSAQAHGLTAMVVARLQGRSCIHVAACRSTLFDVRVHSRADSHTELQSETAAAVTSGVRCMLACLLNSQSEAIGLVLKTLVVCQMQHEAPYAVTVTKGHEAEVSGASWHDSANTITTIPDPSSTGSRMVDLLLVQDGRPVPALPFRHFCLQNFTLGGTPLQLLAQGLQAQLALPHFTLPWSHSTLFLQATMV